MKAHFLHSPHKLNITELDSKHAVTDTIRKMFRVVPENQTVSITTLFSIRASVIAQRRETDVNCFCQIFFFSLQRSRAPVTNAGTANTK